MAAGEAPPRLVQRSIGAGVGWDVPDGLVGEFLEAEIGAGIEPQDLHPRLQQADERQEQRAVEPVLVEVVRRHVRCRDHHDAQIEQPREQPAEDHRIGDVGDMEFVEAETARIPPRSPPRPGGSGRRR